MDSESFPCQLITWAEAFRFARDLAKAIKSSGYHPDLIIAIGRGGYVPARIVCDFMLHNLLTSIKIEHWGIAARKQDTAEVRFPLSVSVAGLKVLIIDDVTDTGETLKTATSYVKGEGAAEIKTGVLQHKVTSPFEPDYYADLIKDWKWIIYPWAAHEDLVGFVNRILTDEPLTKDMICSEAERRFCLAIDREISDVIQDLVGMGKAERIGKSYRKIKKKF